MDSTISIIKATHNNREYPAIRFNPAENIPMSFVQEAVFALIGTAVNGLTEKGKAVFLSSLKENILNIFDKPQEELLEFWDKCGYKKL